MNKGNLKEIENYKILDQIQHKHSYSNDFLKINHTIMLVIDPKTGEIIDANAGACLFYQYNYDHIIKLKISDINLCTIEEIDIDMKLAVGEEKNCFYFKHRLANGDIRDVEVHSGPITQKNRQLLYSIIIDITDSKKIEEEMIKKTMNWKVKLKLI